MTSAKRRSAFCPPALVERARANIAAHAWARDARDEIVQRAQPWRDMSDRELWDLVFGCTITRAWMVWSDGYCPACKRGVPMYEWRVDALARPWKLACPHCNELFPKNDFGAFYRSGLDARKIFDPGKADRSLLFNADHPEPDDPLHLFGVDDGEGFVAEGHCWRFIGFYLVYGQWKQLIVAGITRLAAAALATGEAVYARKTGILLDRVADLYPTFDFLTQAYIYEEKNCNGYVSTWHDACEETREMVLAYDQVFEPMREDAELVAFLHAMAREAGLENDKASFADVQRNIETRLLRDALANPAKIYSNYPRQEIALTVIRTVLEWPTNRDQLRGPVDDMIETSTRVDGVTGERGVSTYSSYVIQALAGMLGELDRLEPGFLADVFARYPRLHETYRFHIDTMCLNQYYPAVGDDRYFAARTGWYQGVLLRHPWNPKVGHFIHSLQPSPYTFLWEIYKATGDAAFVQVMVQANGGRPDGIPHDLFASDPKALQHELGEVMERAGPEPELGSINKREWGLAILRGGAGDHARAAWLMGHCGGNHFHRDGMNLGLYARNLDLMPDFGYPPVQFGGWQSPRADWYRMTASHNTVVVDGKDHAGAPDEVVAGETTLWVDEDDLQATRMSNPGLIGGEEFSRLVAVVPVSDEAFYIVDVFRVRGGRDHAKFMHSAFGAMETSGLALAPTDDYGFETQMRNFHGDPDAKPGWAATWTVEDHYGYLPNAADVHLRYTDLTHGAAAHTCEGWINAGTYETDDEQWINRLMIRRTSDGDTPLASTFVAVIEPFGVESAIANIRRLPLAEPVGDDGAESDVAIEVEMVDGCRDLIICAAGAAHDGRERGVESWGVTTTAELCVVRRRGSGKEGERVES